MKLKIKKQINKTKSRFFDNCKIISKTAKKAKGIYKVAIF